MPNRGCHGKPGAIPQYCLYEADGTCHAWTAEQCWLQYRGGPDAAKAGQSVQTLRRKGPILTAPDYHRGRGFARSKAFRCAERLPDETGYQRVQTGR